jgi:cyclase
MSAKRLIPCLDIKDGQTVKGVRFEELVFAGDPVLLAQRYAEEGADELCFLDITATNEKRKTLKELVARIAKVINIPFTVGGGVSSLSDFSALLDEGADKITVNSAAFLRPELIDEAAKRFGSQCVVAAVDAKKINGGWFVHTHGGKKITERKLFDWSKELQERGAGEILFTSMDNDGTKNGFAIEALRVLADMLDIPVIASGGAGSEEHFTELFRLTNVDAALAASIFHFGEVSISSLKKTLSKEGFFVRTLV